MNIQEEANPQPMQAHTSLKVVTNTRKDIDRREPHLIVANRLLQIADNMATLLAGIRKTGLMPAVLNRRDHLTRTNIQGILTACHVITCEAPRMIKGPENKSIRWTAISKGQTSMFRGACMILH